MVKSAWEGKWASWWVPCAPVAEQRRRAGKPADGRLNTRNRKRNSSGTTWLVMTSSGWAQRAPDGAHTVGKRIVPGSQPSTWPHAASLPRQPPRPLPRSRGDITQRGWPKEHRAFSEPETHLAQTASCCPTRLRKPRASVPSPWRQACRR